MVTALRRPVALPPPPEPAGPEEKQIREEADRALAQELAACEQKLAARPEAGIDDFSLTERSGKTVIKEDLLGKPWVACFVFTRCAGPCPRVSGQFYQLQKDLKDLDFRLVTFTVDPKNDTPEVLARYAESVGADPEKWLFLTGDQNGLL